MAARPVPGGALRRGNSNLAKTLMMDDEEEHTVDLLLLSKGAVLAHRSAHPLAAESDDDQ